MRSFPRPIVVASRCLGFAACRYNGLVIADPFVAQLAPHVEYITPCPEVDLGLGVPREPIRVVKVGGELRLVQPATGRDITQAMRDYTETFLSSLGAVDGFILKTRSPSCGIKEVKVYPGMGKVQAIGHARGFFGGAIWERFPHLAVEDEGRLNNWRIREHFLARIFTLAAFRAVKAAGTMQALVRFQAENKLLLLSYHQEEMRALGRIVANHERRPLAAVLADYERHLRLALARPPRCTSAINVLMHALGYFSSKLTTQEKQFFLDTLERFRRGQVPLSVPNHLMRAWIVRFGEEYLAQQTFFAPYPDGLIESAQMPGPCNARDYWQREGTHDSA